MSGTSALFDITQPPPSLTVTLPASATEGDGVLAGSGVVSISAAQALPLDVDLASDDTTELMVESLVILPAFSTFVEFDLTVIYDGKVDGTRTVTVIVFKT